MTAEGAQVATPPIPAAPPCVDWCTGHAETEANGWTDLEMWGDEVRGGWKECVTEDVEIPAQEGKTVTLRLSRYAGWGVMNTGEIQAGTERSQVRLNDTYLTPLEGAEVGETLRRLALKGLLTDLADEGYEGPTT